MTVLFDFQTHTHTHKINQTDQDGFECDPRPPSRRPAAASGDQRRPVAAAGYETLRIGLNWYCNRLIEDVKMWLSLPSTKFFFQIRRFHWMRGWAEAAEAQAEGGRIDPGGCGWLAEYIWMQPVISPANKVLIWVELFLFLFLFFFLGGKERKKKKKGDVFSAVYRRFWCYSRLSFPLDNRIGTGDFATVSPPVAPEISKRPFVKKKKKKRNQYGHFFVVDFCFQLVGLVRYDCDKHWHISLGSIHFDSALIRLDLTGLDGRLDFRTVRLYLIRLFLISFRLSIDSLCPTWIQFSNFIGSPESGHVPSVHCRLEFVLSNEKSTGFEQTWSELNSIASQWTPSWR